MREWCEEIRRESEDKRHAKKKTIVTARTTFAADEVNKDSDNGGNSDSD